MSRMDLPSRSIGRNQYWVSPCPSYMIIHLHIIGLFVKISSAEYLLSKDSIKALSAAAYVMPLRLPINIYVEVLFIPR